ncbi:hypothetical protein E2C01_082183 [Portunus trituberculatus]|uniref:Uncharacterized protein n=1 Tax=Portunus trituberculatus TaxID=210409 RepID=A0A5B7J472_PORTR|nr:hypothetical protein [Portunus trituberculatus]
MRWILLERPLVYKKVTCLNNILHHRPTSSLTERLIRKEAEEEEKEEEEEEEKEEEEHKNIGTSGNIGSNTTCKKTSYLDHLPWLI